VQWRQERGISEGIGGRRILIMRRGRRKKRIRRNRQGRRNNQLLSIMYWMKWGVRWVRYDLVVVVLHLRKEGY